MLNFNYALFYCMPWAILILLIQSVKQSHMPSCSEILYNSVL